MKNILTIFVAAVLLAGCGQGEPKMRIVIDAATRTFSFQDVASGQTITSFNMLTLEGKRVVDTHVTTGFVEGVVFALNEGEIVRTGNSVTISGAKAITKHAVLKYKLENGVLSITGIE